MGAIHAKVRKERNVMSLYGKKYKIDGVPCGIILRGGANGQYQAVFEREFASLEDIEAIHWDQPVVEGDSPLPAGYGFEVGNISYDSGTRSYTVTINVARQYLGDVTGYVAQVEELESQSTAQRQEIADLQSQLAETDEALIALYEAQAVTQEEQAQDNAQEGGEVSA